MMKLPKKRLFVSMGMEFLHWPTQRLLRKEIRRGQSCDILESVSLALPTKSSLDEVRIIDSTGNTLTRGFGPMPASLPPNSR